MKTITNELDSIHVGDPAHFGNLTLFPLFRKGTAVEAPDYELLDAAIAGGTARVTELAGGGSVPELQLHNFGEKPLLVLDGEELIGAKQNRTVNLTVLAPVRQSIVIPVSCVEAGRWRVDSECFQPAPHVMYSRGRASRAAQVTASMAACGAPRSDQSAVWNDIAAKAQDFGAHSPTQAMSALYDSRAVSIEAYLRAFRWVEGQAGVLFAIDPLTVGFDLFDSPSTMRSLFPKLLRSYALDALDVPRAPAAGRIAATEFIKRVAGATLVSQPAVGLGKDVRLMLAGGSGAALWAERYIHVCAFTTASGTEHPSLLSRIIRPTRRRAR